LFCVEILVLSHSSYAYPDEYYAAFNDVFEVWEAALFHALLPVFLELVARLQLSFVYT